MQKAKRAPDGAWPKEDTGRRIDTWLSKHNPMSTRTAARLCGIPFETMRRYRSGTLRPSVSALAKLATIGLTPAYVYGKDAEERARVMSDRAADEKAISDYLSLSAEDKRAVRDLIGVLGGGSS